MATSSDKLRSLYKIGDVLLVRVVEKVDEHSWIVSLDGTLIRVVNATGRKINEGETAKMRVQSFDPPQLTWE